MTQLAGNRFDPIARLLPFALGVVCLAPFVRLLSPGDAIVSDPWRDYGALHLPLSEFAREELVAGRLPLWNPYVGCGQPLHAAQQASLCYPLATPLVVACGANGGLKLSLFAHLAMCFLGTYLVARRLELSPSAAGYAALATTWGGALMGHLAEGHASIVFATALSPWFFLALAGLLASPGPMAALGLALAGAACALADHPQILYYTLVAGVLMAAGSLGIGLAAAHRRRVIGWGAAAGAIVVLIAAVQLLPTLELVRDGLAGSGRGSAQFGGTYALDGADTARLLMPYLNGTPFARVPQFDSSDHYHERVVYLGLAVPLLAAYGLSRAAAGGPHLASPSGRGNVGAAGSPHLASPGGRGNSRPHLASPKGRGTMWQWGAAWGVVLALAVAFGDSTPAFGLLSHLLPGLSLFRCPGRVFCVASLPAALLAARGLDALANGEPRARGIGTLKILVVALCTANLLGYSAVAYLPSVEWHRYAQYVRAHLLEHFLLWAILAADGAAIFVLAVTGRLRGWAVSLPLMAVAALDLGYFNAANFRMERRGPPGAAQLPPADCMTRLVEASDFRYLSYDGLRYSRWVRATIPAHRPAVGTYDGGVLPAATARLYKAIEADAPPALAGAACRFAWAGDGGAAKQLDDALPRVYFVPDARDAAIDGLGRPPHAELAVEALSESDVRWLKSRVIPVKLVEAAPRRLEMSVDAPSDGWLVVADTDYPGWICEVDGEARAIERAQGVFRRLRVEAGSHRVVMSYEPHSFRVGLFMTGGGIAAAAALLVFHLWRRRAARRRTTAGEPP